MPASVGEFAKPARSAVILLLALLLGACGLRGVADECVIEARDFDEGNVQVSLAGQAYADGPSCIWNGGEMPNRAEYVLEFPLSADYVLWGLYAAGESRPVEIHLDGRKVEAGFAGVTGSWQTKSARWERQCVLRCERGTHTLTLQRDGPFPHICALRLQSPEGAVPRRLSPEEREDMRRLQAQREIGRASCRERV